MKLLNSEEKRLKEAGERLKDWKLWGCYVSERAWGTVREDYSADGSAWEYFPFEHALYKAYRWNEDGIAGICDREQKVCFAVSFWNGADEILKERFFGVGGNQGNHGEDVKEYYFHLDNTPTHSYMKFLYKYPQTAFPYEKLLEENKKRDKTQPEFELSDTGIFDDDKYFDVFIEYAKADFDDICIKITVCNRGDENAQIHILPTVWFRNTWSWFPADEKPLLREIDSGIEKTSAISIESNSTNSYKLYFEDSPELLFTENETNFEKLYKTQNKSSFTKDAFNANIVEGKKNAVNPAKMGTKAAAHYFSVIEPNSSREFYLRLQADDANAHSKKSQKQSPKGGKTNFRNDCKKIFRKRLAEADAFYNSLTPENLSPDAKNVMRQALAGMLWNKQFYHFAVEPWLKGDPAFPPPPAQRLSGRNSEWKHLHNDEVLSMPDKWEYPWYAAWDLAFHCIPLALVDAELAKRQLILLLREWYMHPNGQIPAYEWSFSDVNPPVHAWAALRIYKIQEKRTGEADRIFLEKVFHKLLLNFTWWVNRKDLEENNIFEGGFLGLDNIGVFDRNSDLPFGGHLEQSDGTSWMAMYCLNMLAIALELAKEDIAYEDVASKFFEHFVYISDAMNNLGNQETELWNEDDGFYYDVLHLGKNRNIPLKVRSMVGLIPLFAVETLEEAWLDKLPHFKKRTDWFLENRPDLTRDIACMQQPGRENRRLLALVNKNRLERILSYMLSEEEFLSEFGIRSLSRFHRENPYVFEANGEKWTVKYEPAESESGTFGGNSNWRGPIWFPVNFLLIESLQKFDHYYGENFKIEFPSGSDNFLNLWQVSQELEKRLSLIFLRNESGKRPVYGANEKFQNDDYWRDHILFYEYFQGDKGTGLGASHQTGWTGLMAKLLQQLGEYSEEKLDFTP